MTKRNRVFLGVCGLVSVLLAGAAINTFKGNDETDRQPGTAASAPLKPNSAVGMPFVATRARAGAADNSPWWKDGTGGITGQPNIDDAASNAAYLVASLDELQGIGAPILTDGPVWRQYSVGAYALPDVQRAQGPTFGGGGIGTPGGYIGVVIRPQPGVPAIPEPHSWAMLLVGFGAIGMAHRVNKRVR